MHNNKNKAPKARERLQGERHDNVGNQKHMKTQGQIRRKIHPNNGRNQSIQQERVANIPRSYRDAVDRGYQALESGVMLDMPGILCGRKFDVFSVLWLLAKVLFNCERTIDADVSKGSRSQPRFRSAAFKSHDEKERVRS